MGSFINSTISQGVCPTNTNVEVQASPVRQDHLMRLRDDGESGGSHVLLGPDAGEG